MNRHAVFGTVLAVVAFFLSVVFAVVPPNMHRSEIVWQPETSDASGTLILTRGAPESMEIETSCDKVRAADPLQPLMSAGSIILSLEDSDVVLAAEPESPAARVPLPIGMCTVVGRYDHAASTLTLSAGESSDAVITKAPSVTGLVAHGASPAIDRVVLRTQPTGITMSLLRWSMGLLALALAGGSLLLIGRTGVPSAARLPLRSRLPRPRLVDGVVLVSLVVLAVLVPALYDDGWVVARSGMILDRGWFGNVYTNNDAWLPQAFLHELVLALLQNLGWQFVHLRVLMAVGLAITWLVLRHYVLDAMVGRHVRHWLAAATFTAFSGAWLITVRAEPVVVMLGTLTLLAWAAMDRQPRPIVLAAGIVAAGVTISTHQSGWVVLGPLFFLLQEAVRAGRAGSVRWLVLLAATTAGGAVAILTVFAAVDIHTALDGGREFTAGAEYTSGILSEPGRYFDIFSDDSSARVFTVLLVGALALTAAFAVRTDDTRWRLCLVSFAWLGGLLLTSSKWPWHFGVYAVPATVFAALTADGWRQRERAGMGRAAVLPAMVLLVAMALNYSGRWGDSDLTTLNWSQFSELFVRGSRQYFWYGAVLVVGVLGLIADHGRFRRVANCVLVLAVATPLLLNMFWIVRDSAQPGWSFAGSNVRELVGDDSCGVLSEADIIVGADPLPELTPAQSPARGGRSLAPDAFPRVHGLTTGPLDGALPVWGTWFEDESGKGADAVTGTLSSPEYKLSGERDLTIWTAAGTTQGMSMRVVFSDEQGVVLTTDVPLIVTQIWSLHTLVPPEPATSVSLLIEDASTGFGGWAAVSAPAISVTDAAPSVFENARGYTSPFQLTHFPCVELPDLGKGYWAQINYAPNRGLYFNDTALHALTVTEVVCVPGTDCMWRTDYHMADFSERTLG